MYAILDHCSDILLPHAVYNTMMLVCRKSIHTPRSTLQDAISAVRHIATCASGSIIYSCNCLKPALTRHVS